jgi:hypothetical protein
MEIEKAAMESGMVGLEQAGILKSLKGETTLNEVYSVARESEIEEAQQKSAPAALDGNGQSGANISHGNGASAVSTALPTPAAAVVPFNSGIAGSFMPAGIYVVTPSAIPQPYFMPPLTSLVKPPDATP